MNNNEALGLLQYLSQMLDNNTNSTQLNFALVKNIRKLQKVQKDVQDTFSKCVDPNYDDLMSAMNDVKYQYAQLDGNGNPMRDNNGTPLIDASKMDSFEMAVREKADTNSRWRTAYINRLQVIKDVLDLDSGFVPYPINISILPPTMNGVDFIQLASLIEGMDE